MTNAKFDMSDLRERKRKAQPKRSEAASARPKVKTAWGRALMRSIDRLHKAMEAEGVKLG